MLLRASHHSPRLECLDGEVNRSSGIVVGHADGIGGDAGSGAEDMKEDDSCFGVMRLLKRKRHQPVQVAQVCGDEDDRRMGPSAWPQVRHDPPIREEVRTSGGDEMCQGARGLVRWITKGRELGNRRTKDERTSGEGRRE